MGFTKQDTLIKHLSRKIARLQVGRSHLPLDNKGPDLCDRATELKMKTQLMADQKPCSHGRFFGRFFRRSASVSALDSDSLFHNQESCGAASTIILEEAGNVDSPTLLIFIGYFGFLTRKTKLLATLNCFFVSEY